jgi:16S rRNA (adenine1518-N6/adenine1519-N6)-dimethyltransferase
MRLPAKKRLGQNFLIDPNIRRKIIAALDLSPSDTVLEIGPGRGELTALIVPLVAKLYVVELDRRLAQLLQEKFRGQPKVKIIRADILKLDLAALLGRERKRAVAFGNIPYYISSPIIRRLVEFRANFKKVFLTVQKEFARRLIAGPGSKEYGAFTCYAQFYFQPRVLFEISRNCFRPAPKVDSCFISLEARKKLPLPAAEAGGLFRIIRGAFGKRRKTLRNSLRGIVPEEALREFFRRRAISENTRPEELSLGDFIALRSASINKT